MKLKGNTDIEKAMCRARYEHGHKTENGYKIEHLTNEGYNAFESVFKWVLTDRYMKSSLL